MVISSVQKAIKILNLLSDSKNTPITLAKICDKTNIPKPTCSHILSTLVYEGFAEKVSHTKGYILGPAAFCITRHGRYGESLVRQCMPIMKWLHKYTGHTVVLSVLKSSKKFIIASLDDENYIFSDNTKIREDDIYRNATGRILLSKLPQSEAVKIYNALGTPKKGHWDEVTSIETFQHELSKIDKKDVLITVFDDEENQNKTIGYGKALFQGSTCVGALGIAVKCKNEEYENFKQSEDVIIKLLSRAVSEINKNLTR